MDSELDKLLASDDIEIFAIQYEAYLLSNKDPDSMNEILTEVICRAGWSSIVEDPVDHSSFQFRLDCLKRIGDHPKTNHSEIDWPTVIQSMINDYLSWQDNIEPGSDNQSIRLLEALVTHYPTFDINTPSVQTEMTLLMTAINTLHTSDAYVREIIDMGGDIHRKSKNYGRAINFINCFDDEFGIAKLSLLLSLGADPYDDSETFNSISDSTGPAFETEYDSFVDYAKMKLMHEALKLCALHKASKEALNSAADMIGNRQTKNKI